MEDAPRQGGYYLKSKTDDYITPPDLYKKLNEEFDFNFDACPLHSRVDNLKGEWGDRTFCNPPYSNTSEWIAKANEEWRKGKLVVLLIPVRTDTVYFHANILNQAEIRYFRGRIRFHSTNDKQLNRAPFPSMVCVFYPTRIVPKPELPESGSLIIAKPAN